jgi:lactate permease
MWNQVYDPFSNTTASTIAAALPVVTLLVLIASNKVKAHIAAIVALIVANLVAILIFTLPANLSLRATVLGAVTGFFPIGWIVLNVIFLYRLTVEKGVFETRRCRTRSAASPTTAGCSFCSLRFRSAHFSRALPVSVRRWR